MELVEVDESEETYDGFVLVVEEETGEDSWQALHVVGHLLEQFLAVLRLF